MPKVRLSEEGKTLIKDFATFGHHLKKSKDIDPLYPVLKQMHENMGMDRETALWHTFLYLVWYNLPSGHSAFERSPEPSKKLLRQFNAAWPTGVERRRHRGGNVDLHIASYLHAIKRAGSQTKFYTQGMKKSHSPKQRWNVLYETLQTISGNGRWAAFKGCELLMKVHDLPIECPDMGHRYSSAPRKGLALLFGPVEGNTPKAIELLDRQSVYLQEKLAAKGYDFSIEELETILCNFYSMYKGKYYIGHDIDELAQQLQRATQEKWISGAGAQEIWKARRMSLPKEYLGEFDKPARYIVDKKAGRAYKKSGKVLVKKPRGKRK